MADPSTYRPAVGSIPESPGVYKFRDEHGRVIYAQVGPRRTLRAPGHAYDSVLLLDADKLAFTTATQREQVKLAKKESGQLRLVGQTLPIGAAVAGFVLAVAGGVLLLRGRRRPESPESPQSQLTM